MKGGRLSLGVKSLTIPYTTFHVQTLTAPLSVHQTEFLSDCQQVVDPKSGSTHADPWLE